MIDLWLFIEFASILRIVIIVRFTQKHDFVSVVQKVLFAEELCPSAFRHVAE